MTTTHSIDLNLDLTRSHGATEAAIDSLVASGLVGAGVPARPQPDGLSSDPGLTSLSPLTPLTSPAVAGERDARPYQAVASSSASVAAFRRAMAEPIAENAALGEAFAAAVAAAATEPGLTRSHGATEVGEEAVIASGVVGRDVLGAPSASPVTVAGGDVRDASGDSDVRPTTKPNLARSHGATEAGLVGARVPARPQDPAASAAFLPSLDSDLTSLTPLTPLTSPDTAVTVAGGDVRDMRGDSDVRLASPAVAADSPAIAADSPEPVAEGLSSVSGLTSLPSLTPLTSPDTAVVIAGGDMRDVSDVLDAPTAEPSLSPSRRVAEPGDESSSLASLPSLDSSLASLPPLTPLTSPDTAVASAVAASTPSAPAAPSSPSTVLVQAAEAVADTLLVSPGLLRGQGEIVVQLRPDVLDGTEVRIAVTGRQLDVQFCPTSVEMAVMLENGRVQIASHLSAKIASFNVTVDVRKKRA